MEIEPPIDRRIVIPGLHMLQRIRIEPFKMMFQKELPNERHALAEIDRYDTKAQPPAKTRPHPKPIAATSAADTRPMGQPAPKELTLSPELPSPSTRPHRQTADQMPHPAHRVAKAKPTAPPTRRTRPSANLSNKNCCMPPIPRLWRAGPSKLSPPKARIRAPPAKPPHCQKSQAQQRHWQARRQFRLQLQLQKTPRSSNTAAAVLKPRRAP